MDFYAPAVNLVIEIDGGQHFEDDQIQLDKKRDAYLKNLGLTVLRFDNLQVLQSIDSVMDVIFDAVKDHPL